VFVTDHAKALRFYTKVLGFTKKKLDTTLGKFRWLTVVSPEELEGTQLLFYQNDNLAARTYRKQS
jgi:catechol 2,3-dioxygenase-like lactoylglutathione lyase family enzyme